MVLGSIIKSVGKVGSKEGERKEIHQTAREISGRARRKW